MIRFKVVDNPVFENSAYGPQAWVMDSMGQMSCVSEGYKLRHGDSWVQRTKTPDTSKQQPTELKERIVYRFEEVDKPEKDEKGNYWYLGEAGQPTVFEHAVFIRPLRYTVERIVVEVPKYIIWTGRASVTGNLVRGVGSMWARVDIKPGGISFSGNPCANESDANQDLVKLVEYAEDYAGANGAIIKWVK